MKIAVFQMSAALAPADRPERIIAAMREAATAGASLMIAPELALSGYGRGADFQNIAQTAQGDWAEMLQSAANETGIGIVAGFPERDGAQCFISAITMQPGGAAPVIYRKACLYGDYEKEHFASAQASTILAEIGGIKAAFLICYDVEFPENVRRLARAGADLIIVPTALPKGASAAFVATHLVPTRAFENQVFVAYADNADSDDTCHYQGQSCIAAPSGAVLAAAPVAGDALIYADIDVSAYDAWRDDSPYLSDAERYGLI